MDFCRASWRGANCGAAPVDEHHAVPELPDSGAHLHHAASVSWEPQRGGRLADFHKRVSCLLIQVSQILSLVLNLLRRCRLGLSNSTFLILPVLMWWQIGGTAPSSAEAELAMRVNDMWFLEPGGEPLTFREVFLKSHALENIIAGEEHEHLLGTPLLVSTSWVHVTSWMHHHAVECSGCQCFCLNVQGMPSGPQLILRRGNCSWTCLLWCWAGMRNCTVAWWMRSCG